MERKPISLATRKRLEAKQLAANKTRTNEPLPPSSQQDEDEDDLNVSPIVFGVIDNALTAEECSFLRAAIDSHFDKPITESEVGDRPDAMTVFDGELLTYLWARAKNVVPAEYEGRSLVGPHDMIRLMRYNHGGSLTPHTDRGFEGTSQDGSPARTFITLLLYLNQGFVGGGTRFFQEIDTDGTHTLSTPCDPSICGFRSVVPLLGRACVFQHDLYHMVDPVEGRKYAIRLNILYKIKNEGEEEKEKEKGKKMTRYKPTQRVLRRLDDEEHRAVHALRGHALLWLSHLIHSISSP